MKETVEKKRKMMYTNFAFERSEAFPSADDSKKACITDTFSQNPYRLSMGVWLSW